MDFKEMACEVVDWIHLTQKVDQWWDLVTTVMKLLTPL
jgi:hypothetical protein